MRVTRSQVLVSLFRLPFAAEALHTPRTYSRTAARSRTRRTAVRSAHGAGPSRRGCGGWSRPQTRAGRVCGAVRPGCWSLLPEGLASVRVVSSMCCAMTYVQTTVSARVSAIPYGTYGRVNGGRVTVSDPRIRSFTRYVRLRPYRVYSVRLGENNAQSVSLYPVRARLRCLVSPGVARAWARRYSNTCSNIQYSHLRRSALASLRLACAARVRVARRGSVYGSRYWRRLRDPRSTTVPLASRS
jgi:hypothetical protein